jgi:hypothetical protein
MRSRRREPRRRPAVAQLRSALAAAGRGLVAAANARIGAAVTRVREGTLGRAVAWLREERRRQPELTLVVPLSLSAFGLWLLFDNYTPGWALGLAGIVVGVGAACLWRVSWRRGEATRLNGTRSRRLWWRVFSVGCVAVGIAILAFAASGFVAYRRAEARDLGALLVGSGALFAASERVPGWPRQARTPAWLLVAITVVLLGAFYTAPPPDAPPAFVVMLTPAGASAAPQASTAPVTLEVRLVAQDTNGGLCNTPVSISPIISVSIKEPLRIVMAGTDMTYSHVWRSVVGEHAAPQRGVGAWAVRDELRPSDARAGQQLPQAVGDWLAPRGFGSCYLLAPALSSYEAGEVYLAVREWQGSPSASRSGGTFRVRTGRAELPDGSYERWERPEPNVASALAVPDVVDGRLVAEQSEPEVESVGLALWRCGTDVDVQVRRPCDGGWVVVEASWRRNFETLMVLTAGVLFSVLVEVLVRAGDRAQRPPPPPPSASKSA